MTPDPISVLTDAVRVRELVGVLVVGGEVTREELGNRANAGDRAFLEPSLAKVRFHRVADRLPFGFANARGE